jgi:hypothetical protein
VAPAPADQATRYVTETPSYHKADTLGTPGAPGRPVEAVMVKVSELEVPPPGVGVKTLTAAEPALARSDVVMVARSWLALTNVVVRLPPFQRTTEPFTNPLPLTVSVSVALPAEALVGDRLVATGTGLAGAVTVKVSGAEVPPPGVGV